MIYPAGTMFVPEGRIEGRIVRGREAERKENLTLDPHSSWAGEGMENAKRAMGKEREKRAFNTKDTKGDKGNTNPNPSTGEKSSWAGEGMENAKRVIGEDREKRAFNTKDTKGDKGNTNPNPSTGEKRSGAGEDRKDQAIVIIKQNADTNRGTNILP
jgi:hypothetical protein